MALVALPSNISICIDHCRSCNQICADTVTYAIEKGGPTAAADRIQALVDCAELCRISADLMSRRSRLHTSSCTTCAEACDACAAACEAMAGDPQMDACADACRSCADACRRAAATPMMGKTRMGSGTVIA